MLTAIILFLGLRELVEGDDGRITLLHTGNQIFAQNLTHPVSSYKVQNSRSILSYMALNSCS